MIGIQIKIAGQWIELPDDFSISLEQSSPLFNDEGVFSFPFEIPLGPNRRIFKNISDPFGDITLSDIDRMDAEVWFDGVMLYRGIIETDEEVEFENTDQGTVPVTFLSGNSDFKTLIEGLNARDIPLDREIKLGYVVNKATFRKAVQTHTGRIDYVEGELTLPDFVMMNYKEYNVSDPYPVKPFCNVRVCTSDENGYYKVLEAKRPFSGVCFYVLYLLDCLFKHLGIAVKRNDLPEVEDMCRLAFFNTQCHVTMDTESVIVVPLLNIRQKDFCGDIFSLIYSFKYHYDRRYQVDVEVRTEEFTYQGNEVYATNENYPSDLKIEDLISDLKTAFGVRFLYNSRTNTIDVFYIKDILRNQESETLDADILDMSFTRSKPKNTVLTYGNDDDTSFNYTDFSNVKIYDNYDAILDAGISRYDKVCKIDRTTGNAYRVKVNKETGSQPSLFEVGGFRDYKLDAGSDEEDEQSINFSPVIVNAVSVQKNDDGSATVNRPSTGHRTVGTSRTDSSDQNDDRVLAIYADVEMLSSAVFEGAVHYIDERNGGRVGSQRYPDATLKALCPEMYDTESNDEPPLRSYDAGYTLGIMRGAGNDSGVETVTSDYDGEGNDSWVQTVGSYSFTSDSCDMYGRFFDYNGTEGGGVDQSGRFSLKLVAEKEGYPIGDNYKNRGLVSKFLSEYLYFMAHKKTVMLTVKMSITQIINIDFLKRYRIGNYVGFINKVSYSLTANGIEDITIELYTL